MILTKEFINSLGCPEADSWVTENGLYGATDVELLEQLKLKNPLFFEQAKPLIELRKAILIKESGSYSLGRYRLLLESEYVYETEFEKSQKVLELQSRLFPNIAVNFVVNHAIVEENGDHTWVNVDLYDTEYESNFNVFNPLTGQYIHSETLEEAKQTFELVKQQLLDSCTPPTQREIIGASGETSWIFERDL